MLNKLLLSQIREYSNLDKLDEFQDLFVAISKTYDQYQSGNKEQPDLLNPQNLIEQEIKKREAAESQLEEYINYSAIRQRMANICTWELVIATENLMDSPITLSEAANGIFGCSFHENISFSTVHNYIHPEDQLRVLQNLQHSVSLREMYDMEHRIIAADGSIKIVHTFGEVMLDANDHKPLKIIGIIQEITAKKLIDEALEDAHKELKTLFENMKEASFTVDVHTSKIIQISQACTEIYGYSVQEFKDNSLLWLECILEKDKSIIYNNYRKINSGTSITQEYRIHHKNGDIRWVETSIIPTLREGKLVRIDGVTSDITKRKEAEIALKASEYKFRTLLQNSSDAILVVNEASDIIFASDSIYHTMGFSVQEVLNTCSLDYIYPGDLHILEDNLQNVLNNPSKTFVITYRRVKKDGTVIWCEGSSTNLLHDPTIKGIVINFKDITERIQYIEALKYTNSQLQKNNDELDRFVYSVSHDLRAPLSSILGAIEYSETETNDPDLLETFSLMKGSAKKLDDFILDLLDYSKNTRLDLQIDRIDLKDLLFEIKSHLKYMGSPRAMINIQVDQSADVEFYSDRNRLSVVLNNLISNGIRYCNTTIKDPIVEVVIDVNHSEAMIVVKDNGIGIDEKYHAKIFDMFYRVSAKSEGSGLGLYIVKDTIKKLNGSLQLKSVIDEGTEFTIFIPNHNKP